MEVEARLTEVQEREGEQLRKMQQTNLQLQQKIKVFFFKLYFKLVLLW